MGSFNKLKDHRRKEGKRHPLEIVLLIIIMAIMAGSKSERAISRFAKNNKQALIKALKIARKEIPSRSVIQGIIQQTDFSKLQNIFYGWALKIVKIEKNELEILIKKLLQVINKAKKENKFLIFLGD